MEAVFNNTTKIFGVNNTLSKNLKHNERHQEQNRPNRRKNNGSEDRLLGNREKLKRSKNEESVGFVG